MAVNDLTGQNIQDTYQKVVQTDGVNLADGLGSPLPISFNGNNVIISGSLSATEYIVTSSVTNVVFQQQSGSTIFGDSLNDTHAFTGSLKITGSFLVEGNTGANLEIGTYNVGFDWVDLEQLRITGSGLIVSGAMDSGHHAMVKIGDVELVDVNTDVLDNTFLIRNVKNFTITSGSIDGGDVTQSEKLIEHKGNEWRLFRSGNNSIAHDTANVIHIYGLTTSIESDYLTISSQTSLKVATYDGNDTSMWFPMFNTEPNGSPQTLNTVNSTNIYKHFNGNITASNISASGDITSISASVANIAIASGSNGGYVSGMYFLNNPIVGFVVGNTDVDTFYRAASRHQYLTGRVVIGGSDPDNGAELAVDGQIYTNSHITASGTVKAEHLYSTDDIEAEGSIIIGGIFSSSYTSTANHSFGSEVDMYSNLTMEAAKPLRFRGGWHSEFNPYTSSLITSFGPRLTITLDATGNQSNEVFEIRKNNQVYVLSTPIFSIDADGSISQSANITASGDISASGEIFATDFHAPIGINDGYHIGDGKPILAIANGGTLNLGANHDTYQAAGVNIFVTGSDGSKGLFLDTSGNVTASGVISSSATSGINEFGTDLRVFGKIISKGSDVTIGEGHISMSGHISGGLASTASFAHIVTQGSTIEFRDGASKLGTIKMTTTGDMTIGDETTSGKSKLKVADFTAAHITASGNISGSLTTTGSFSHLIASNIQGAGNPSSVGLEVDGYISSSGNISSSANIYASGSATTGFHLTNIHALGLKDNTTGSIFTDASTTHIIMGREGGSKKVKIRGSINTTETINGQVGLTEYITGSHTTDGITAQGEIVKFGQSLGLTAGAVYYLKQTGVWVAAQANAGGAATGSLAVALGSSAKDNGMLLRGMVKLEGDPQGVPGQPLYLDDTGAGRTRLTAPDTAGDYARVVGYYISGSGTVYFNPDNTWVKVS